MTSAVAHDREPLRAHQLIKLGNLTLTSEREGAVHSICLFGELDVATAEAVQVELTRAEAGDAARIVLDLSGLTFISSTGIRLLYSAATRSRHDSGRLGVRRGGAAVQRVVQLTAVEDQLPFVD